MCVSGWERLEGGEEEEGVGREKGGRVNVPVGGAVFVGFGEGAGVETGGGEGAGCACEEDDGEGELGDCEAHFGLWWWIWGKLKFRV